MADNISVRTAENDTRWGLRRSRTHWGNGLPPRFASLAGVNGYKSRRR
jgi:hypothetical protein